MITEDPFEYTEQVFRQAIHHLRIKVEKMGWRWEEAYRDTVSHFPLTLPQHNTIWEAAKEKYDVN